MLSQKDFETFMDATVHDREGDRVGRVGQLFLDDETGAPSWVTVHTGFFGLSESFVPIDESTRVVDGRIDVPYDKDMIKDAPRVNTDGHLDPADEESLYGYYGRSDTTPADDVTQATVDRDRLDSDYDRESVYDRDRAADLKGTEEYVDADAVARQNDQDVADRLRSDGRDGRGWTHGADAELEGNPDRWSPGHEGQQTDGRGWTHGDDAVVNDTDNWSPGHERRNPGDDQPADLTHDLENAADVEGSIDERRRRLRRYDRPAL